MLPVTSKAFMLIVSKFEKRRCLPKSSFPLLCQSNFIKRLATGAIILFPHTPSSILSAYYGHSISNVVYMPQIFNFPDYLFCNGVLQVVENG